jgi:hypothetical protein
MTVPERSCPFHERFRHAKFPFLGSKMLGLNLINWCCNVSFKLKIKRRDKINVFEDFYQKSC